MCKSPVTESKLSSRRVSLPWGKTVHSLNGLGMADLLSASDDANLVPGMWGCMSYGSEATRGLRCSASLDTRWQNAQHRPCGHNLNNLSWRAAGCPRPDGDVVASIWTVVSEAGSGTQYWPNRLPNYVAFETASGVRSRIASGAHVALDLPRRRGDRHIELPFSWRRARRNHAACCLATA